MAATERGRDLIFPAATNGTSVAAAVAAVAAVAPGDPAAVVDNARARVLEPCLADSVSDCTRPKQLTGM